MGDGVPGGHKVAVVDHLNEGLDASAGQDATTSHGLGDGLGAAVDSNDDGVGEGASLGGLLDGLNDDSLAAGKLSLGEENHLSLLQELNHLVISSFNTFTITICITIKQLNVTTCQPLLTID